MPQDPEPRAAGLGVQPPRGAGLCSRALSWRRKNRNAALGAPPTPVTAESEERLSERAPQSAAPHLEVREAASRARTAVSPPPGQTEAPGQPLRLRSRWPFSGRLASSLLPSPSSYKAFSGVGWGPAASSSMATSLTLPSPPLWAPARRRLSLSVPRRTIELLLPPTPLSFRGGGS